jgi:hypothetical protein
MLDTLGFRIPAEHVDSLLGQVAAYPWTDTFTTAWQSLPRTPRRGAAPARRPPYGQLQTGLIAAHGYPVKILDAWQLTDDDRDAGIQGMIVSSMPIRPFVLATCLRTFERRLHKGGDPNRLAPALPVVDATRAFRDVITHSESGTALGPGWLFESATWAIMAQLATTPLQIDGGPSLALRLDTSGSLLAWTDLLTNRWNAYIGRAMLRITARIINQPGCKDLIVVFDAHLSRINDDWRGVKNVWIERENAALPVLHVPVRHIPPANEGDPWTTELANDAAAIAEACGMERLDLDQTLPPEPGRIRPLISTPRIHPIGKGPGARLMLRLAEHIQRACPELEPLSWTKSKNTRIKAARRQALAPATSKAKATSIRVTPDVITAAVRATGLARLRVLCLYTTSDARHRMTQQLRHLGTAAESLADNDVAWFNERIGVSFHHVPRLLEHGRRSPRELPKEIATIAGEAEDAVVAWVETEYDPTTGSAQDDAKPLVRRTLAQDRISSQFMATLPAPTEESPDTPAPRRGRRQQTTSSIDHSAMAGASDLLLRTIGVVHPDLASDILLDFLDNTGHDTVRLVGLHARLQKSGLDHVPPKLILTATDIQAHREPTRPWPVRMWSDRAQRWLPQPHAIADFHAGAIGSTDHGRRNDKAAATRMYVESMLSALPTGPMVLFLDARGFRTIYPGLQNHHFGVGALPGATLANPDLAIVRCNTTDEVPRPVNRHGGNRSDDAHQPASPDGYVYQLEGHYSWLFPKKSRLYKAKGGATGARFTPWTLPDDLKHLLRDDWHSYNGTEICVPQPGPWTEQSLVNLTARLCENTVVWDDRTVAPMPLHMASRADLTHPEYRTDEEA